MDTTANTTERPPGFPSLEELQNSDDWSVLDLTISLMQGNLTKRKLNKDEETLLGHIIYIEGRKNVSGLLSHRNWELMLSNNIPPEYIYYHPILYQQFIESQGKRDEEVKSVMQEIGFSRVEDIYHRLIRDLNSSTQTIPPKIPPRIREMELWRRRFGDPDPETTRQRLLASTSTSGRETSALLTNILRPELRRIQDQAQSASEEDHTPPTNKRRTRLYHATTIPIDKLTPDRFENFVSETLSMLFRIELECILRYRTPRIKLVSNKGDWLYLTENDLANVNIITTYNYNKVPSFTMYLQDGPVIDNPLEDISTYGFGSRDSQGKYTNNFLNMHNAFEDREKYRIYAIASSLVFGMRRHIVTETQNIWKGIPTHPNINQHTKFSDIVRISSKPEKCLKEFDEFYKLFNTTIHRHPSTLLDRNYIYSDEQDKETWIRNNYLKFILNYWHWTMLINPDLRKDICEKVYDETSESTDRIGYATQMFSALKSFFYPNRSFTYGVGHSEYKPAFLDNEIADGILRILSKLLKPAYTVNTSLLSIEQQNWIRSVGRLASMRDDAIGISFIDYTLPNQKLTTGVSIDSQVTHIPSGKREIRCYAPIGRTMNSIRVFNTEGDELVFGQDYKVLFEPKYKTYKVKLINDTSNSGKRDEYKYIMEFDAQEILEDDEVKSITLDQEAQSRLGSLVNEFNLIGFDLLGVKLRELSQRENLTTREIEKALMKATYYRRNPIEDYLISNDQEFPILPLPEGGKVGLTCDGASQLYAYVLNYIFNTDIFHPIIVLTKSTLLPLTKTGYGDTDELHAQVIGIWNGKRFLRDTTPEPITKRRSDTTFLPQSNTERVFAPNERIQILREQYVSLIMESIGSTSNKKGLRPRVNIPPTLKDTGALLRDLSERFNDISINHEEINNKRTELQRLIKIWSLEETEKVRKILAHSQPTHRHNTTIKTEKEIWEERLNKIFGPYTGSTGHVAYILREVDKVLERIEDQLH